MFHGLKLRPQTESAQNQHRISDRNFESELTHSSSTYYSDNFPYLNVIIQMQPNTFIGAPISNQQLIDVSTFHDARRRNMHDQSQSCIYADTTNAYSVQPTARLPNEPDQSPTGYFWGFPPRKPPKNPNKNQNQKPQKRPNLLSFRLITLILSFDRTYY